jgi:hypothetical protein
VATEAVTDAELERLQAGGHLLCQCPLPDPEMIGLFHAWQCRRCFKALRHTHQLRMNP